MPSRSANTSVVEENAAGSYSAPSPSGMSRDSPGSASPSAVSRMLRIDSSCRSVHAIWIDASSASRGVSAGPPSIVTSATPSASTTTVGSRPGMVVVARDLPQRRSGSCREAAHQGADELLATRDRDRLGHQDLAGRVEVEDVDGAEVVQGPLAAHDERVGRLGDAPLARLEVQPEVQSGRPARAACRRRRRGRRAGRRRRGRPGRRGGWAAPSGRPPRRRASAPPAATSPVPAR